MSYGISNEEVRRFHEPDVAAQEEHPVYPRFEPLWDQPFNAGSIPVRMGESGPVRRMTSLELDDELQMRRTTIQDERTDPYRYGYEPEMWREADWRLAELRVAKPGEPIVLGVLGGNGSAKTWYGAKRYAMCMVENEDWLCWQLALDETSSREVPQQFIYHHLPAEFKTATGKHKKTANTKLAYNKASGFTDNIFSLENKCRSDFKFYGGGDVNSLEGPRPNMAWCDEMVPIEWVRGVLRRLMTKAEQSKKLIPQLKEALAARARGVKDAYERFLKPILAKLFVGVCLITFTPKNGYTRTVAMLTNDAQTLVEVPAELLPKVKEGVQIGFEKVPRVQFNDKENAIVLFFHIYDNPFGGNWEAQKKDLAKKGRSEKLWRAYGVATKVAGVALPTFKREAHVRSETWLPKVGTWYHVADPCHGRNWFMIWAKVAPNVMGAPFKFIAREWPQEGDWIVAGNVGNPGPWATLEPQANADGKKKSDAAKMDGERGPAQMGWGLGTSQIAAEIERVEKALYKLERRQAGDPHWETAEGRIEVKDGCRIMDGRAGNTATQTHGESITLIEVMEQYGLYFTSAGRDSGAEAGSTTIREGVQLILDALQYDEELADLNENGTYVFEGRSPSLMIAENCTNTIFCLQNWTGQDGGKGATKDPVDTVRYMVIANPEHIPQISYNPYSAGGSY